jgi:hypothetical protein
MEGERADYDRKRLAEDTLALLTPATPVIVHMETLRRAAIYASGNLGAAQSLFGALRDRARRGGADPLDLFDYGYLVEAYKQAGYRAKGRMPGAEEDGYALVVNALSRRGRDPEMEYAAALMSLPRKDVGRAHLARAREGAAAGSSLARTLEAHKMIWSPLS